MIHVVVSVFIVVATEAICIQPVVESSLDRRVLPFQISLYRGTRKVLMALGASVFEPGSTIEKWPKFSAHWRGVEYIAFDMPGIEAFRGYGFPAATNNAETYSRYSDDKSPLTALQRTPPLLLTGNKSPV